MKVEENTSLVADIGREVMLTAEELRFKGDVPMDDVTYVNDDEPIKPLDRELPWLVPISRHGGNAHAGGGTIGHVSEEALLFGRTKR